MVGSGSSYSAVSVQDERIFYAPASVRGIGRRYTALQLWILDRTSLV